MPVTPLAATPVPLFGDKGRAFHAVPRAVAACRKLVQAGMFAHGMTDLSDSACSVISELAANAIDATQAEHQAARPGDYPPVMVITLDWMTAGVRIGIWDGSPGIPEVRSPDRDAESGRGLLLVGELTAGRWGWFTAGSGKCVWAEVVRDTQR